MQSEMKFINDLKNFIKNFGGDAYLVGGFVREKLINSNSQPKDIDVIYDGDMEKLLKYLKEKEYKFFKIKQGLDIYRAIDGDITMDISKIKGNNIEEDLNKRDFTINAICLKLVDNNIIDLFKGRKAIECRIIQQVNEKSIQDDPIRILRGIRFYIKHGMHFNLETENNIIDNAVKLNDCAKERILYELMSIIQVDKFGKAFEKLDDYKILPQLFPYMNELKSIGQCKYHIEDTFTHMNLTYGVFKDLINGNLALDELDLSLIDSEIGNFKMREYIALAAFLHDIGKVKAYKKEENKVSFSGHEEEGIGIVKEICNKLGFPKESTDLIENIVQGHMYPLGLFKCDIKDELEAFYKFFDKYNKFVPYILMVSFCDVYATRMLSDPNGEKEQYKSFIERLLMEYKRYDSIKKDRLINGNEVMNITGKRGQEVKVILKSIDKLRFKKKIKDKDMAYKYLKEEIKF